MLQEIHILKAASIMATPQRIAILRIIRENHSYLEAKLVYNMISHQYPNISTATVYRTIELFRRKNILKGIKATDAGDGEEPDFRSFLICSECNRCYNLPFPKESLEDYANQVSKLYSYRVTGQKLNIYGCCPQCQKHGEKPS